MGASRILELYSKPTTTFNLSFTQTDTFQAAATKLRFSDLDFSGLKRDSVPDPSGITRMYEQHAPIPTVDVGDFSFTTWLGGAESDLTANPIATLMEAAFGGISLPSSSRTVTLSGTHGLDTIQETGLDAQAAIGSHVMVGVKGDGRGGGECRRVVDNGTTDQLDLHMNYAVAPNDADVAVLSTSVYLDEDATQKYVDFLLIGHPDTKRQIQMIGCICTGLELVGLGAGEVPGIKWTWTPAAIQWPTANLGALDATTAPAGNDPPVNQGLGGFFLQDAYAGSAVARTIFKGAPISMGNFLAMQWKPSANGINFRGGATKVPPEPGSGPTFGNTLLIEEDHPGLLADFLAGATAAGATAKGCLAQFGDTAQRVCVVDIQRGWVNGAPVDATVDGQSALNFDVAATEGTDNVTTDLARSAVIFSWL